MRFDEDEQRSEWMVQMGDSTKVCKLGQGLRLDCLVRSSNEIRNMLKRVCLRVKVGV